MITIEPLQQRHLQSADAIHAAAFAIIGQDRIDLREGLEKGDYVGMAALGPAGELLGYSIFSARAPRAYGNWFAVAPDRRRTGVGAALLKASIAVCEAAGCQVIELDTRNRFRDAMRFYLANDFDITGTWLQMDGELMIRMRRVSCRPS